MRVLQTWSWVSKPLATSRRPPGGCNSSAAVSIRSTSAGNLLLHQFLATSEASVSTFTPYPHPAQPSPSACSLPACVAPAINPVSFAGEGPSLRWWWTGSEKRVSGLRRETTPLPASARRVCQKKQYTPRQMCSMQNQTVYITLSSHTSATKSPDA